MPATGAVRLKDLRDGYRPEFRKPTRGAWRVRWSLSQLYGNANMGTHMKTTIEISDAILEEAKEVAAKQGVTLRSLVEEGLRRVLGERRADIDFELPDASYKGKGLQPEVRDGSWERIRELIYEGRGG